MTDILIAIFIIVIVISITFSIFYFFLNPLFLKPKFNFNKTYKYLENKNYSFIEYREIKRKEKRHFTENNEFSLEDFYFSKARFRIIAKNLTNKEFKIIWLEIKKSYSLFKKDQIHFSEEPNSKSILKLENKFNTNIFIIKNQCPACNSKIYKNDSFCDDCGLSLS